MSAVRLRTLRRLVVPPDRLTAAERTKALEGVVPLAYHLAHRICPREEPTLLDDIAHEVMAGFAKSAGSFNPSFGFRFTTYAYRAGLQAGLRFISRHMARGVRIPMAPLFTAAVKVVEFGEGDDGERAESHTILAPPDADRVEEAEFWEIVAANLPPRHHNAVLWRFRDGLTLAEIARHLGVSRERARQVIEEGLTRLRKTAGSLRAYLPDGEGDH